jgi:flagellar hook-associated protein 1
VLSAAERTVVSLNATAAVVAEVRREAQRDIESGVARLNALLAEFGSVNAGVVNDNILERDVTDAIDRRNGIIRDIAELVDVRPTARNGNDIVLFLGNGATLFETTLRSVVTGSASVPPTGQAGAPVFVDGIPLGAGSDLGGRLGGLLRVRDQIAVGFGQQADEIARGLIVATAEYDRSAGGSGPPLAGLFTYSGGPALPASGSVANGLAGMIRVNPNVDPSRGGLISRLRDGGIAVPGNPAYVSNPSGGTGYGGRLRELVDGLGAPQAFDGAAGIGSAPVSVLKYSAASTGWLQGLRSETNDRLGDTTVLAERTLAAWQDRVGVNIDDQFTLLISLERSFQASSRLLGSFDEMFGALLRATE